MKIVKSRIKRALLWMMGGLAFGTALNMQALAAGTECYFGSQEYDWALGQDSKIAVYLESDQVVDGFEIVVSYDPNRLELVDGAQVQEAGQALIQGGDGTQTRFQQMLTFRPLAAGNTRVDFARVQAAGGPDQSDMTVGTLAGAAVEISGSEEVYLSDLQVAGQTVEGFLPERFEYEIEVPGGTDSLEIAALPVMGDSSVEIDSPGIRDGYNDVYLRVTSAAGEAAYYHLSIYRDALLPESVPAQGTEAAASQPAGLESLQETLQEAQSGQVIAEQKHGEEGGGFLKLLRYIGIAILTAVIITLLLGIGMYILRSLNRKRKLKRGREVLERIRQLDREELYDSGEDWESLEEAERIETGREDVEDLSLREEKRAAAAAAVKPAASPALAAAVSAAKPAGTPAPVTAAPAKPAEIPASVAAAPAATAPAVKAVPAPDPAATAAAAKAAPVPDSAAPAPVAKPVETPVPVTPAAKEVPVPALETPAAKLAGTPAPASASPAPAAKLAGTPAPAAPAPAASAPVAKPAGTPAPAASVPVSKPAALAPESVPAPQDEVVISVQDVTMRFRRAQEESASLKEFFIRTVKRQNTYEEFTALEHISFDIKKGEVIGIIGSNGSGKSTILKIISGVLQPSEGRVVTDTRKIQLLTLGTGFDAELTGRENVYLNGAIIGYTKEYIDQKYDSIVKFAELEGFMEERVKNYSSGMVSRLGFAIATMRDTPEILILDEVLSVGDMFFQKKSQKRIKEMIHGGSTVLIVTHSTGVVTQNCNRAIWIEKGKLMKVGAPAEVCKAYTTHTQGE